MSDKKFNKYDFNMFIRQDAMSKFMTESSLSDVRLIGCLLGKMTNDNNENFNPFSNVINITQKEIAEELQVCTMTVYRSIKRLVEKNYITQIGRGKIKVNPHIIRMI